MKRYAVNVSDALWRSMLLAVAFCFLTPDLLACPNCKAGFGSGTTNASVGDAYSISVLFMLAVPLALVTVFTIVLSRRVRHNEKN